ncbi:hypothetical protein C8F01DRAFT_1098998 [Mycena amicta]|nr:hypothetical protein C8F01DRAFT_1098998 [Mycena amicta]
MDERNQISIQTLPPELISEIFVHSLSAHYPLCPPLAGLESPTQLLAVCHLFRTIALSTPLLWRAIRISRDDLGPGKLEHPALIERMQTWLRRSGETPLSIKIDFNPELMNPAGFADLLAAIAAQGARWEYLHLGIDTSDVSLLSGPAPLLKELNITIWEESLLYFFKVDAIIEEIIAVSDAPRLRYIFIWDDEGSMRFRRNIF